MNLFNRDRDTLPQKVRWGRQHGAFVSDIGQAVARVVDLGVDDKVTRELVEAELRSLRILESTGQLPPFRATRQRAGELLLGTDCYGQPIRLPLRALAAGTLLLGNTGAGK